MPHTAHDGAPPAPPATVPEATPTRRIGLLAHLGAIAQLAAMGLAGTAVFTVLLLLLSLGLGLLPALGIGAVFLVGAELLRRNPSRALALRVYLYSLMYLALVFGAMVCDTRL